MKNQDAMNWVNNYAKKGSIANALLKQSINQSGIHSSKSGSDHLTLKNQDGNVTGHVFLNNKLEGFTDSLKWLGKK